MVKRLIFDIDGTLIQGVNFIDSIAETLKKIEIYSEENVKLFLKENINILMEIEDKVRECYDISDKKTKKDKKTKDTAKETKVK